MYIRTYKEFLKELNNKFLKGAILISGEDKKLIEKSVQGVYEKVDKFQEFNIVSLSGDEISLDNIINACETLPFMCDKKILHIKNPAFLKKQDMDNSKLEKQSKSHWNDIVNFLIGYVNDIPEHMILLITFNGVIDNKNKFVNLIKSTGYLVEYRILKGEEIQKWTESLFKDYGKTISKADIMYFLSEVGSSTERVENEVNKLCSYVLPESKITKIDIDAIINKGLESNVFKMVDNITRKNVNDSISILNNLLFQKEDFTRILGMIIRQFRLLYLVKLESTKGKNIYEIKEKHKLNEFVVKNLMNQSDKYNLKEIKSALYKCLNIDFNIKSGKMAPELGLEMLVVELCK